MTRTTKAALATEAEWALRRALDSLALPVADVAGDPGAELVVSVDGRALRIAFEAASVVTPEAVVRLTAEAVPRSDARVVVGDLITTAAQEALREAGWGWLDRRGHLVLRAPGLRVDADVAPDERASDEPERTLSGMAAISWAAALLLSPDDPPSMRGVARRVSISHSAIVAAGKRLRAASLLRADGRPLVPELFWVLAEEWRPTRVPLAERPPADDTGIGGVLATNLQTDGPGWAVAGTLGAAAWGAPVAVGLDYPPDFYVPSSVELRQAVLRLGEVPRFEDRACTVAVAPTPLVVAERDRRASREWGPWRFAHGLFAALDLAQDVGRGAEILADWNPSEFARVW